VGAAWRVFRDVGAVAGRISRIWLARAAEEERDGVVVVARGGERARVVGV